MQRRKHRLLIFWLVIFFPFLHPSVYPSRLSPTLPLGPFTLPVRCVVLIRTCSHRAAATKAKKAKHPRGLSCHWWMKGMRKRMEREYVCLCVSLRARAHVCVFWFVSVFNRALLWEKLNRWVHITRRCNRTEASQPWVQDIYNNIGYIMTITKDLIA